MGTKRKRKMNLFNVVDDSAAKINKSIVEIITPLELIKKADKVGSSEAALLAKLGIRLFSYGLVVLYYYDNGSVFTPKVLDLTEDALIEKFATGVLVVTSLLLAISYPALAAAPHMFVNAYKNVLVVAVATKYSFHEADKVKEFLKDPSKFVVAAVAAPAADSGAAAAKEEEKKDELMVWSMLLILDLLCIMICLRIALELQEFKE